MNFFDKIKQNINPENDPAYDEQDEYSDQIQNGFDTYQPNMQNQQQYTQGDQYTQADQYQQTNGATGNMDGVRVSGSSLQLKVVKPTKYKQDAAPIAVHLLNRCTVVLNLEETDKENARRLLDFLGGVAYSIGGKIKRVANNTYVITPCNVDIAADQLRRQQTQQMDETSTDIFNEMA